MRKSHSLSLFIPLAVLAASYILNSCKDDVFNIEKVKATYQDKFPVKDIDPQMDWKMTRQVTVDVSVYEDYGVDYTVEIFDRNPFDTDTIPHLLSEGTANQDLSFHTTIDCPNVLSTLYVTRVDPAGRRLMKPVYISNDRLTTSFGSKPETRAFSRAATDGSEVALQTMTRPYTDKEVEAMLAKATEYKGQDMDADIDNQTLYKITGTYKKDINYGGGLTPKPQSLRLIIAPGAKWEMSSNQVINQGLEIIVASQGEIKLKSGSRKEPALKFTNTSSLVVLGPAYKEHESDDIENTRGKISGHGWIEFSNGGTNYSAGEIDIDGINNNGGTFFNYGKMDVKDLIGSSTGSVYINHGDIEADKIGDSNSKSGPLLENSCKIEVEEHLSSNGIKMGLGSCIKCKHLYVNGYIDLSANSMIKVENNTELKKCNITGPTADKSYALLKLNHIKDVEWDGLWSIECTEGYIINNIYCEYNKNGSDREALEKLSFYCLNGGINLKGKGNGNASMCLSGEAPQYVPAGRCTGEGNTPNEDGSDITKEPYPYTYVFEDNFPLVGDYDFNDIVLDVSIEYLRGKDNKITTTHLTVTLAAAGASKTVGAGLRIVGEAKNAVDKVEYSGKDKDRFLSSLKNSMFGTDLESDGTIPLFGNEHEVFGVPTGTLINTGDATAEPRTLELFIEQKNSHQFDDPSITKEDLDFFIAYRYRTMQKRMEVHLYEFWEYGATAAGTIQKENLDVAGNNTWAICVSGSFRYPKELINISDQKNIDNCAYPEFLNWARDRSTSQDWYLRPNEKNVYR